MIGLAMMLAAQSATLVGGTGADGYCAGSLIDRTDCAIFVVGISDGIAASQQAAHSKLVCIPAGTTREQVRDEALKYLRANPDKRQWHTATLVWIGLAIAYPCPK